MFKANRAVILPMMVAAIAACQPAIAQLALSDSQEPGSVLVFPYFEIGVRADGSGSVSTFTISVTCPTGAICPLHQAVNLRLHWVCPASAGVCAERDFLLTTSVNGTVVFTPGSGGSIPAPPCGQGFLLAWVVNTNLDNIKFDGLIGRAVIRDEPQGDTAYNAIPIQAAAQLANMAVISSASGSLPFDGTANHYKAVTGEVTGSVSYPGGADLQTFLVLLTLDVMSNRPNGATFVDFNFYNEAEALISNSTSFTCWGLVPLSSLGLSTGFGVNGLVQSGPAQTVTGAPVTVLGLIFTFDVTGGAITNHIVPLLNNSLPVATTFVPEGGTPTPPPPPGAAQQ